MSLDEFKKLALAIKTYYPREFIFPNEAALSMWYEELKDLDYDSAGIGLRKYVLTNRLPPAISDIRAYASAVDAGDEISENQAWEMVYRALGNSGLHADEEFAKLPKVVQRAVHSPGQLREWGKMDIKTVNSVIYSLFVRAYQASCAREKREASLPKDLLRLEQERAKELEQRRSLTPALSAPDPETEKRARAIEAERIACEQNADRDPEKIAARMAGLRRALYGDGAARDKGHRDRTKAADGP